MYEKTKIPIPSFDDLKGILMNSFSTKMHLRNPIGDIRQSDTNGRNIIIHFRIRLWASEKKCSASR